MRILRFTALLSLLAMLAFGSAYAVEPMSACAHGEPASQAQLEAQSDVADTPPLHSIGEFFPRGSVVESPRRLIGARLQIAARFAVVIPADEPGRATLLELRRAEHDRREIGNALLRDAAGAASFHTTTPPPLHA